MDRASAARLAGMDRQTLRDWVHRYNEAGIAGLSNRPLVNGHRSFRRNGHLKFPRLARWFLSDQP
jgi:transposase-like protein